MSQTRRTDPVWHRARHHIDGAAQTIHRITVEVLEVRPPDAAQRAKVADANAVVCVLCASEPPCTAQPTTVAGNLPEPRWVGRTCYDRVRATGRPPSRRDLEHLNRTGRWPKVRADA